GALALIEPAHAAVTKQDVEEAIRGGIRYLHAQQQRGRGWPGQEGTTALATLALLTAGDPPHSDRMRDAIKILSQRSADQIDNTYAVALQIMPPTAADPREHRGLITRGASWLERTQINGRFGRVGTPGAWSYNIQRGSHGDNSNTQYALLGLHAAREAG